MKKLLFIYLALIIFLVSCNPTNNKSDSSVKIDTTGYYTARDLKGLATFRIDESTFDGTINQIKNEIRNDKKSFETSGKLTKFDDYMYLPKENSILNKEHFSIDERTEKNIKTIEMHQYFAGELEIKQFKLIFYHDTLINITCSSNEHIEKAFSQKYGKPKSITETQEFGVKSGNRWENQKIKATSYIGFDNRIKGAIRIMYFNLEILSKNRITNYMKQVNENKEAQKKLDEIKDQENIKKL